jgi:hypothetical protein
MRGKRVLIAGVMAGLLYGQSVQAGPYTLQWEASAGATAYRLYQSTDNALTWQKVYEGAATTFTVDIQGSAIFLFSVSAISPASENARRDIGAWAVPSFAPYNGHVTVK